MHREPPWSLESLVDFERELTMPPPVTATQRNAVVGAIRGLTGSEARRKGLRVWLAETRTSGAGQKFSNTLSILCAGICVLTFIAGVTAVLGLFDRNKGGINGVLFIAVLLGGQWLILLSAGGAWLVRRRAADGFSGVQALIGKLARKFSGCGPDGWWRNMMESGSAPRAAVLWRIARLSQAAGIWFNVGIIIGLAGMVMVRHVGFFWETTTELAMRGVLENGVRVISFPWAQWWPTAVPNAVVLDGSRWLPGRTASLAPGPAAWWEFLLMATFVWGLLPRAVLWVLAWQSGRRALRRLDFQGRGHRALWRELTGTDRIETDEKPLDGVLVLDIGGCGFTREMLRPFILQRLRVHPAAWHPVAVMDAGAEVDVARALANAPAGVVLLDEGWSLSPARMLALHGKIRLSAGPDAPIKFLIVNVDGDGNPAAPTSEEKCEWERFVDSLRDPSAEVFMFEKTSSSL